MKAGFGVKASRPASFCAKNVDAQKLEVRTVYVAKAEKLRTPHKRNINWRGISVRK